MISIESKTIGTKDLQKISAKYLDSLGKFGPEIVVVNGIKRAVLVDYEQYVHLQKRFRELISEAFAMSQIFPKFTVPQDFELKVEQLQIKLVGTLQQIVSESSETSPFADLMDSIMAVAMGVLSSSESAPAELKRNAKDRLARAAKPEENISARPKRNLTE